MYLSVIPRYINELGHSHKHLIISFGFVLLICSYVIFASRILCPCGLGHTFFLSAMFSRDVFCLGSCPCEGY